jgi:hypothetical protein
MVCDGSRMECVHSTGTIDEKIYQRQTLKQVHDRFPLNKRLLSDLVLACGGGGGGGGGVQHRLSHTHLPLAV